MRGEKKLKRQLPAAIDRGRSLEAIPVVNGGVSTAPNPDGTFDLVVRIPRRRGWFSRFMPSEIERRCRLDELGSYVWRQIDGRRTVMEIIDRFAERYGTSRREAELCTVEFLRRLAQRRLISLAVP